jgi:galactokinase
VQLLKARAHESFVNAFACAPDLVVQAPARVNLIGEHTDYNEGFVLPCAIGFYTVVMAAASDDHSVSVVAADFGNAVDVFDLESAIISTPKNHWSNYVRGVVDAMRADGHQLVGTRLALAGNIPRGAGLSSSASLCVAVAQVFARLNGISASAAQLARWAQRAEHTFAGCQCGIMDPLVIAAAIAGHALRIDCRSLDINPIPLPEDWAILVVDSRIERKLGTTAYNVRRAQCEAVTKHFGITSLRELDLEQLNTAHAALGDELYRRARHVLTENRRVAAFADALADEDAAEISRLMAESQTSMRDDYEITVPAIDHLVSVMAGALGSTGGVRMTGGGFGGCVIALLPQEQLTQVQDAVVSRYRSPGGHTTRSYVCGLVDGVLKV